jgi:hypothetical protein
VTVWAVELGQHTAPDEVKGTLALVDDALAFAPEDPTRTPRRIPLGSIGKVRRLRGSPVLVVMHAEGTSSRRTAFYFVEPPPLGVVLGRQPADRSAGLASLRNPKRKARRDNVGYLGVTNREKKAVLSEWVRAVREAVGAV